MNDGQEQSLRALLLTIDDVARLLSVSTRTVRRLRQEGRIPPPVCVGRSVRWNRESLRQWIESGCPATKVSEGSD